MANLPQKSTGHVKRMTAVKKNKQYSTSVESNNSTVYSHCNKNLRLVE